jgi:hypothetical protein
MEEEKIKLMRRIAKEGHSFPHGEFCSTCQEDFDEVYNLGIEEGKKIQREIAESYVQDILKNDIFLNKLDAEGLVLKIKELAKVKQEAFENGIINGKQEIYDLIGGYFEIENGGKEETKEFKKRHNLK